MLGKGFFLFTPSLILVINKIFCIFRLSKVSKQKD